MAQVPDNRQPWAPKPADRVVRRPREEAMRPVHLEIGDRRAQPLTTNPVLILVYAFVALISVGTLLLMLPISYEGDGFAPFVDALFTATSAATVTGLIVQETSSYWTTQGQLVIMVLMFSGGLGIMTIVGAMLVLGGQRVSMKQRMVMRETIGTTAFTDIAGVTLRIVLWAFAIQVVGFVVLIARFSFIYPSGEAVWHALFQAVSGFNNAGFTSLPASENLSAFGTDKVIVGTIGTLVLLGSLSYWVVYDVVNRRSFWKLTLNSKLVLVFSGVVILSGAAFFLISEFDNPATFGTFPLADKLTNSVFHSINRTAGFSTVDFGQTKDHTNLFYAVLMFIGGASGSVAGGIKVNTFALIVIMVIAAGRGQTGVSAFRRRIPDQQIRWALVLAATFFAGTYLVALAIALLESEYPFLDLLFESVSAISTVGLSSGITGSLKTESQLLLVVAMFIGRIVPPMVIVVALSQRGEQQPIRYPKEEMLVG